ncbi:MAG: glycosyltransferase family 1 protein [Leptospiraceae bacterium]|nr:glycosyltransferase family 1 protein [Leptospiraceae bacterium]MCB1315912.1 glycosyltransferase family 1 protein [Leptospiraceae bacterium]
MRIAYFTETFLPNIDGVALTLARLLTHLNNNGHRALLFAPAGSPARYANQRVISLPGIAFPLYPEIKLVSPMTDVSGELRRFQPDLVHLVNPVSLGLAGLQAARSLQIPLAASFHTDIAGFARRWGLGIFQDVIWSYLRWVHNQMELNFCPSNPTAELLQNNGIQNLRLWSRGVDAHMFHPLHRHAETRKFLCAGDIETTLLLYVGRLSPEKRIHHLRPLLDRFSNIRLAVVGDGPARSELERQFAGTRTIFCGALRGSELSRAYASADAFVFPSANETFGNVVLEAMASGLPVIAADQGGPRDLVVPGESGFLFDSDDPDDLIDCAQQLLESPDRMRRMGTRGRQLATSRSWHSVFQQLLIDYETLQSPFHLKQAV